MHNGGPETLLQGGLPSLRSWNTIASVVRSKDGRLLDSSHMQIPCKLICDAPQWTLPHPQTVHRNRTQPSPTK